MSPATKKQVKVRQALPQGKDDLVGIKLAFEQQADDVHARPRFVAGGQGLVETGVMMVCQFVDP